METSAVFNKRNMSDTVLGLIGAFLVLAAADATGQGPICFSCSGSSSPSSCNDVYKCPTGNKCYTEKFVTASGSIRFKSGCASSTLCRSSGKKRSVMPESYISAKDRRRRTDLSACRMCCDTDYCNAVLCDTRASNETFCLNCPSIASPHQCGHVTTCGKNEMCFTERIHSMGDFSYRLGCVNAQACSNGNRDLVGRKRFLTSHPPPYCAECCAGGQACNRELCGNQHSVNPNTHVSNLEYPPERQDVCSDIDPQQCAHLIQTLPEACSKPEVARYSCRKSCNCGQITTTPTTQSSSTSKPPASIDCFYKSSAYRGPIQHTFHGKACVPWTAVSISGSLASGFPESNVADVGNKCRDPTEKGHPWCFTSLSGNWEYCPVPYCQECYFRGHVSEFNGFTSKDKFGRTCRPWTSLHTLVPLDDAMFVDGSVANASNYCRDPFGTGVLLCVQPGNELKECEVPECESPCEDDANTNCHLLQSFVCGVEYYSKILCPKTCGSCNSGLMTPKQVPLPKACRDVVGANCPLLKDSICHDPIAAATICPQTCQSKCDTCSDFFNCSAVDKSVICSNSSTFVKYCQKSCSRCDQPPVPIHLNECGDPVGGASCSFLEHEICICRDPTLWQLCANYCHGRCPGVKPLVGDYCSSKLKRTAIASNRNDYAGLSDERR